MEWLNNKIDADIFELSQINNSTLVDTGVLIIASSLHAGNLRKFKSFKSFIDNHQFDKLIVVGVGAAPFDQQVIDNLKQNYQHEVDPKTHFIYLPGGLNYQKMSLVDKLMMKAFSKVMKQQAKKGKFDSEWAQMLQKSYDISDPKYLDAIINLL